MKFQTEKQNEPKRRRTMKRNAVDVPSADVEIFVVADKETVAVHGNESMEGYILTMMNMVSVYAVIPFSLFDTPVYFIQLRAILTLFVAYRIILDVRTRPNILALFHLLCLGIWRSNGHKAYFELV